MNVVWIVSRLGGDEGVVIGAKRRRTHIHGVRIEFSLSHSPAKEGACAVVICCLFCFLLVPSFVSVCFLFSWVILIVDR